MRPFEYLKPRTITEASALLFRHGDTARVIAGGTDLLVAMKRGRAAPRYLIGMNAVPGLDGIEEVPGSGLHVGAF